MATDRHTPARQRTGVSEGVALGLAVLGRNDLSGHSKVSIDLAFTGAWRSWLYTGRFPQVNTDLSKGFDGARVLSRATGQKHTVALCWGDGWPLTIHSNYDGWDVNDEDDVALVVRHISDDVPLQGWVDLARAFLDRLERPARPAS